MSKWKKRLLIALVAIALVVVSLFIFLHDDSDMEAKEQEQQESIDEVTTQDNFDVIGEDLESFESSQDSL